MCGMEACRCGAILLVALAAAAAGEAPGPLAIAEDLLRRFPDSISATMAAARIEDRSGSLDRALSHYARALSLEPASFEAREARGDILSRKGLTAEAAEEYRAAASCPAG